MRRLRALAAVALTGSALATSACMTSPPPYVPPPRAPDLSTTLGPNSAYLMGDIVSGQTARAKLVRAAKIGAVAPGTSGQYMAQQEAEMRRLTAGTGIDVIPYGDSLIIRLPASLAFDVGRADVKPQFKTTLEEIARPLKTFGRTYVDVLGHTDTTGTPQGNQALSQKRAAAVSDYLGSRGVSKARLAAKGYGESVPLYNPDDTELKRASNRRVEIRIVPIR